MEVITCDFELAAVSGGGGSAANIKCTVGNKGISCSGSLADFVGALNEAGAWLGIAIYDMTHS